MINVVKGLKVFKVVRVFYGKLYKVRPIISTGLILWSEK